MKHRTKNDAKLKLEKVMPKRCQHDQKWVQNRAQIDPNIDEKTMRKNDRTMIANILRKIGEKNDRNSKKVGSLGPEGRPGGDSGSAQRNVRGCRGRTKGGVKNFLALEFGENLAEGFKKG